VANPLRPIGEFFLELKRRKVYQVTAVYVVLAVGGMEVLDLLIPATRLPEWSSTFFLGLAIVGLPLVIVFAWTFDITPEGVVRTSELEGEVPPPPSAPAVPDRAMAADSAETPQDPSALDANTIAVLPFENLSGSPEAEPFALGLHDDLLTELSRASALTVISRTSVKGYKSSDKPIREIARELGAGTIVEGGVQRAGNRVRLNIQLIDARTDVHRWAERYDRELTAENIFELQTELAARIMSALKTQLTSEEEARVHTRPTDDLEAYRLYSIGRELYVDRSEKGLREAAEYFQRAIERDPNYAEAWAGLGMALGGLVDYGHIDDREVLERSMSATRKALELDPELPEGYAGRGGMRIHLRDAAGAREDLRRAIACGPGLSLAHQWTGWVELLAGNPERAREASLRATRLSPLDPEATGNLAVAELGLGDAEAAVAAARRSQDLYPDMDYTIWAEGLALYHLGRSEEASRTLHRLDERWSRDWIQVARAMDALDRGDSEDAQEILAGLEEAGARFKAGVVHAALGDLDAAFESLDAVGDQFWDEELFLRYHRVRPMDALRGDPRYVRLIEELDRSWGVGGA
jgi:TolB-like protein/Flp pilus assembly protein TadD